MSDYVRAARDAVCWYCDDDPCTCQFEPPRMYRPALEGPRFIAKSRLTASPERRRYTEAKRKANKKRRAQLAALGLCINGPLPEGVRKHPEKVRAFEHGPVEPGTTKCKRCNEIHKGSRDTARVPRAIARAA